MLVDMYRRQVQQHQQDMARLQERKANHVRKAADLSKRIIDAQQSASCLC
jgi:hypothetical protein